MSESRPPFRDPALRLRDRLSDLMSRLTEAEKLGLLHQHQQPVPRLGIGPFRTGTEALHGVAWLGQATVFPQAVGLAASWNPELLRAVGVAVAAEVRAFHDKDPAGAGLNVWAPVVNPLRDPRWGRNEEGYSEDPGLTARLATAFGLGLAGSRSARLTTAPTLKHFLAYNNETDRCTSSSNIPPRVLYEYELPAFELPLRAGAAVAVMPSYNLVNGRPAHLTPLINDVLRGWTDDQLLVVSDAGAPANLVDPQRYHADLAAAYAAMVQAGVDSFTQDSDDPAPTLRILREALDRELLSQADVDRAAERALAIRFRLGEFDDVAGDSQPFTPADVVGCPAHQELAAEAARQSMVLLKSECRVLPLSAEVGRIAVVGPLGDTLQEDWYSGTLPYRVTALDGVRQRVGPEQVTFCEGVDRIEFRVDGLMLSVAEDGSVALGRSDGGFDVFDWGGGACTLRSAKTGLSLTMTDDGALRADHPGPNSWVVNETFELVPDLTEMYLLRHRTSGRYVRVLAGGRVEITAEEPMSATAFEINTVVDGAARAAQLAAEADVVIVVVGNHPLVNGRETEDRVSLDLPAGQERLVRAVHAANGRTVLVMSSSYPFSVDWAHDQLPALLWSAHGGQEYGTALAEVLFGDVDPPGRLPQTWYRSSADLPDIFDYDIIASDATYQYFRGTPLYPFGHGLSYTTFSYSGLEVSSSSMPSDGDVRVSLTVTNTGSRPGHEIVQLYTHQERSRVKQPLRRLRDFCHVQLAAGESAPVELVLPAAELRIWDVTRGRYCVETARHSVMVGRSATDIRLTTSVEVLGERIPDRDLAAAPLRAETFDEYCGVAITDAATDRGDAVRSLEAGSWIAFDDCDFGSGPGECLLTVASELSGTGQIELRLDDPLRGALLARLRVPPTGHRHDWVDIGSPLEPVTGQHTLYVVFSDEALSLQEVAFRTWISGGS